MSQQINSILKDLWLAGFEARGKGEVGTCNADICTAKKAIKELIAEGLDEEIKAEIIEEVGL